MAAAWAEVAAALLVLVVDIRAGDGRAAARAKGTSAAGRGGGQRQLSGGRRRCRALPIQRCPAALAPDVDAEVGIATGGAADPSTEGSAPGPQFQHVRPLDAGSVD